MPRSKETLASVPGANVSSLLSTLPTFLVISILFPRLGVWSTLLINAMITGLLGPAPLLHSGIALV